MKKLEDIPKQEIFDVPEGYFDKLPNRIQSRITNKKERVYNLLSISVVKYAAPIVTLFVAGILWLNNSTPETNVHAVLATMQTDDLVDYLSESDLTTDELLEAIDFSAEDFEQIEENTYDLDINDGNFEDVFDDVGLNTL
jgi:hypothetical protein